MKPSQILFEAADILDRDGWCRGVYDNAVTGHHCAVGAIRSVGVDLVMHRVERFVVENIQDEAQQALIADVQRSYPNALSVQNWNDEIVKGRRQVTSRMRKVGRKLVKEGR